MKNVELEKGKCAICRGPIDVKWAGENPSLGSVCQTCSSRRNKVFGPENVEIEVSRELCFDPLLGTYEFHFVWRGSRIMVNGKVGTITRPQGDGDFVRFEGEDPKRLGTFIKGVGYWDLLRIYKAQGGETEPPPLTLEQYVPTKAILLDDPILPLVARTEEGKVQRVQVGTKSLAFGKMFDEPELPNLPILHAFANMFVRYKFGLAPNFCAEGGFVGDSFEVRNAGMFTGGVGLSVEHYRFAENLKHVNSIEELCSLAVTEHLIGLTLEGEQSRPGVIKGASANEVIATWVVVMGTLLRYDWRSFHLSTVDNIWEHYCRMQDVLLNIMSPDELAGALEYAREGKMVHAGSSY